jgi:hypothetical protein
VSHRTFLDFIVYIHISIIAFRHQSDVLPQFPAFRCRSHLFRNTCARTSAWWGLRSTTCRITIVCSVIQLMSAVLCSFDLNKKYSTCTFLFFDEVMRVWPCSGAYWDTQIISLNIRRFLRSRSEPGRGGDVLVLDPLRCDIPCSIFPAAVSCVCVHLAATSVAGK